MSNTKHIEVIGLPADVLMKEEGLAKAIGIETSKRLEALAVYQAKKITNVQTKETQKKSA